jgi:cytochrome c biogenesis protein CcmG/thiol:disulfide interchange protein DsbE
MKRQIWWLWLLGLAGCGLSAGTSQDRGSPSGPPLSVQVVRFPELQKALQKYHGRVVVMDVWATWCGPCKEEFPELVRLHRDYIDRGVQCVALSLDPPDQLAAVRAFLESVKATFDAFLLNEDERAWELLDLKSVPAVFVYDRTGKLARKFTNDDPDHQFSYADVRAAVEELLNPSSGRLGQKSMDIIQQTGQETGRD